MRRSLTPERGSTQRERVGVGGEGGEKKRGFILDNGDLVPPLITQRAQNHGSDAYSAAKNWHSVSTYLKRNMTQTITEHYQVCEGKVCIVCEEHFISLNLKGAFEMWHLFLCFFSLVCISKFSYTNFLSR